MRVLAALAFVLVACRSTPPPAPVPPYVPARMCDGEWLRVQAPDGEWSHMREGVDCAAMTPGAWRCCDPGDGLYCHRPAQCDGAPAPAIDRTQPGTHPTADEVRAFTAYAAAAVNARVIDKQAATEMQALADLLVALHIEDRDTFLNDAATTLPLPSAGYAYAIYLPYTPGTERGQWDLDSQMGAPLHETTHPREAERDIPALFTWRYLTSPRWRCEYEAEAYAAQRAYLVWRGALGYPPEMYGDMLAGYGVGAPWVEYTRELMRVMAAPIDQGAVVPASFRESVAWLNEHAPELRGVPLAP